MWLCPEVAFLLDLSWNTSRRGIQEAFWSDAKTNLKKVLSTLSSCSSSGYHHAKSQSLCSNFSFSLWDSGLSRTGAVTCWKEEAGVGCIRAKAAHFKSAWLITAVEPLYTVHTYMWTYGKCTFTKTSDGDLWQSSNIWIGDFYKGNIEYTIALLLFNITLRYFSQHCTCSWKHMVLSSVCNEAGKSWRYGRLPPHTMIVLHHDHWRQLPHIVFFFFFTQFHSPIDAAFTLIWLQ